MLFNSHFNFSKSLTFILGIFIFHCIALSIMLFTSRSSSWLSCMYCINCSLFLLFPIHGVCIATDHHVTIHVVSVVIIAVAKKFLGFRSASNFLVQVICHRSNWLFARILIKFHAANWMDSCRFSSTTSDHMFFKNNFHIALILHFSQDFNNSFTYDFARFFHDHNKTLLGLTNSSPHCVNALNVQYNNAWFHVIHALNHSWNDGHTCSKNHELNNQNFHAAFIHFVPSVIHAFEAHFITHSLMAHHP